MYGLNGIENSSLDLAVQRSVVPIILKHKTKKQELEIMLNELYKDVVSNNKVAEEKYKGAIKSEFKFLKKIYNGDEIALKRNYILNSPKSERDYSDINSVNIVRSGIKKNFLSSFSKVLEHFKLKGPLQFLMEEITQSKKINDL